MENHQYFVNSDIKDDEENSFYENLEAERSCCLATQPSTLCRFPFPIHRQIGKKKENLLLKFERPDLHTSY